MWAIIGTWEMARDGISLGKQHLEQKGSAADAIERAICDVENNPSYTSVGYGGLPNEAGILEMDAAFMDGNTFQIGAVAGIVDVKNPIKVARKLSLEPFNSFRIGEGATKYAQSEGFELQAMLTPEARDTWEKRVQAIAEHQLEPYDGHDTVGMVSLDTHGNMAAGTSTSGLFMKKAGRVGDSPLSGSGFYVDSEVGGATATGLGEDLMKGILSYEITRLMSEGHPPQKACDQALFTFESKLKKRYGKAGAFSVVALDKNGQWGVATNVEFPFCVATETLEPTVFIATPTGKGRTRIVKKEQ